MGKSFVGFEHQTTKTTSTVLNILQMLRYCARSDAMLCVNVTHMSISK